MTPEEAEGTQSPNMDHYHPSHTWTSGDCVEKVDYNSVPQVVEHLGKCSTETSRQNTENHTLVDSKVLEAKKLKMREKRKRARDNKRKRRELSRISSSANDSTSPSTLGKQESSAKVSSLEPSDQAPASAHAEESVVEVVDNLNAAGECSASSSTKDLKGHAQVDHNLEAKEMKSLKRRKKKRKLSSDSSLPSTQDIQGTSVKGSLSEVSNPAPVIAITEELMEEEVSVNEPSALNKENDTYIEAEILEKGVEKHSILCDALVKDVSEKCSGQFSMDKLDADSDSLNAEPMSQNGIITSSKLNGFTNGDDVNRLNIGKEGPQPTPLGVHPSELRKKLLVLDINGILTDIVNYAPEEYTPDTIISRKSVFKRPFCDDFLRFCFEKFHVGVWSSRTMKNVKSAIDFLMGELQSKLLFCWDQTQCTDTGFYTLENREKPMLLKEIKKLWEKNDPGLPWENGDFNESNTLLLDDSPYKALRNPPFTAIFPNPYCYKDVNDNSLGPGGDLRVYLEGLASADDVQKYIEANPFGQRAITNANASWNFYRKVIYDTSLPTRNYYNYQSSRNESTLRHRQN